MKIKLYDKPREYISFNTELLPEALRLCGCRHHILVCPRCKHEVEVYWPQFLNFIGICECGEVARIDASPDLRCWFPTSRFK